jgi:hypothetical protein
VTRDGVGLGDLVEFAVVFAVYGAVGLGAYLFVVHPGELAGLLAADSVPAGAGLALVVVGRHVDVQAVALALAVLAGTSAFVNERTPGATDLIGPDAPSGFVLPFYAVKVGLGIVVGTALGAGFGAGAYLAVVHSPAIEAVTGVGDVLDAVATHPDALLAGVVGGAVGLWSGFTGQIWQSRSSRHGHGGADGGFGGGGGGE